MVTRTGTKDPETLEGYDDSNDILSGLGGDDELYGLGGVDLLDGGDGNDWLDAGLGDYEALYGGNGNDTLLGGGINRMEGGAGDDLYYVNNVDDSIVEEPGEGFDTVRSTVSYSIANSGYVENLVLDGYSVINGTGNGLDNEIFGNVSDNVLSGGGGNDVLRGGDGNDILKGEDGNDHLVAGSGTNQLIGGIGNDTYYVENATTTVSESASEGNDGVHSSISYTLTANVEDLALEGATALNGTGNALNNVIVGSGADNILSGGGGNDYLMGNAGDDIIIGGSGYDTANYSGYYATYNASFTSIGAVQIKGSEGTDQLTGIERINFNGGGFYNVRVGDGADNVLTADPNVTSLMFGGGGNDTITGSIGNDTLAGGNGNDKLVGGAGNDTAIYFGKYSDYTYAVSLNSDGSVKVAGPEGTDTLTGMERINFTGDGGAFDVFTGDGNNNTFTAYDYVAALMYGAGGNDTMTGSIYDDSLLGGTGVDKLAGGSGRDLLVGGSGSDILTGGVGADKFRFNAQTEGIDLIRDFNRGEGDKIEIIKSSFGVTSLSQFSYNSTTGVLSFGSTQLTTLENKPSGFSVNSDVVLV